MLARYEKDLSEPPFSVVAKLAIEKRVSLEWIYTGEGPFEAGAPREIPPDSALLTLVVHVIEETAAENGRMLSPAQKAEAITLLYELATAEPTDHRAEWLHTSGAKVIRLFR